MTQSLVIQLPKACWTEALLDGKVKVDCFPVTFEPSVFDKQTSKRLRGEVEDKYAGTEQVLTDLIVRIARGQEKTLVSLPVFVTRGMVHRKLVMRRGPREPKDLAGRMVGMGRVLGATSVFLRGLLAEEFGVERSRARWLAAEPIESDGAMDGEWRYLTQRGGCAATELLSWLAADKLDALIYPGGAGGHWFNWVNEGTAGGTPDPYGDLEAMVQGNSALHFPIGDVPRHLEWFGKNQIYPLYHCLAVRRELAERNPGLCAALVAAFERATQQASDYMTAAEKVLWQREMQLLSVDPNRCGLNSLNTNTVEKCIDYLEDDGLLPRRPAVREIFPFG
jgi:4,5-dihydroxyphthalate decarboxylase